MFYYLNLKGMNTWFNLMFQDSASPLMEWLIKFHDFTLLVNLLITVMILFIMIKITYNKMISVNIESQMIELIWTILPMIILIFMALPSLKILYLMDEIYLPNMTIKCIGHQWYWTYEFSNFLNFNFESYMLKDLVNDSFRLLDVDNRLVLPMNMQMRFLVGADDVIHSFAVPSLGCKMDGVPGRLNQMNLMISRPGIYFGQCSEICGANHSFMPIVIESTNMNNFLSWIELNF
uniref:Cytochrome c oxidase subunit 2 n=1 Tax=Figites sp. ZJUH 20220010 TaxID=2995277 RepID=A0A9E8GDS5_9HYME|nr:cytochrome c oxidase subunit 2 [Figites sp. ZJUH 20220010]